MRKLEDINIFDEVEAYLQLEDRRPQERHYASSVVQCPRRAWFRMNGVPVTHTISISGYLKMKIGSAIGNLWADLLDETAESSYPQVLHILDRIGKDCPTMLRDIEGASGRSERPYNLGRFVTHHTAREVPFREKIPGCDMELGGMVDNVYTAENFLVTGETKSSHMTRTRMILNGYVPTDYLVQAGIYKSRYSELPAEIHYIDRQTGYPYKFGLDVADGDLVLQPGGFGRQGIMVSKWFKNMPLMEYVSKRLAWMEELLRQKEPPGRVVAVRVPAPRDPRKEFFIIKIDGFEDHELTLEHEDYHMLLFGDGTPITKKKTANKESYSPGFCPYCAWRGLCVEEAKMPLLEVVEEEEWTDTYA